MVRDDECVRFLQWALPRMGHQWRGYRRVRRQVRRRLTRRLRELELPDADAYRARLETRPEEWRRLERLCRITISRFFRDRLFFESFGETLLPRLERAARDRGEHRVRVWSAGCGAGEEPYSIAILAVERRRLSPGGKGPSAASGTEVIGTDLDPAQIARGEAAAYRSSSLREVPAALRERVFSRAGPDAWELRPVYRRGVELAVGDVRRQTPAGLFDAIFCRNLAFTYLGPAAQREVLQRFAAALAPGGLVVVGAHERLPEPAAAAAGAWREVSRSVWRRE